MRLTDDMKLEIRTMAKRVHELHEKSFFSARLDPRTYPSDNNQMKEDFFRGGEAESIKVKLENFYSETDVKDELRSRFHLVVTGCNLQLVFFFKTGYNQLGFQPFPRRRN